ncbi:hypothetical protein [Haloferula rosea]|uniref:Uncharacterized protein n=1 Tax=Haloferula rosea TaxID=490093 RepID=A0A934VD49_9BACT|nr:hypothetical protein [Haloferula rosea]MBK1825919.1 hypothetical protein [Haloferula rosea]
MIVPVFIALLGFLIQGLLFNDEEALRTSLWLLAAIPCLGILHTLVGFSLRCPLCRGPLMRHASCSVSSKARRTLGSLRLRVALSALFRGNIRCQYCGEPCDTTTPRR